MGTLIITITAIVSLIFSSLLPVERVNASSGSWNFSVPGNYDYDSEKVVISDANAQLLPSVTPGDDWIANDGSNSWYYRQPVTIDNSSGGELTDYQIKLTFDSETLISSSKMQSDGDDIRFTTSDKVTAINNYWLEPNTINTSSTIVFVKVPTIAASTTTTIYLYYGNTSATAISSITNTFVREITDLVGAWTFDDTTVDYSGQGNDGTMTDAAYGTEEKAKFGKAADFSLAPNTGYVQLEKWPGSSVSTTILSNSFTFSMWVRQPAGADRGILFGDYGMLGAASVGFEVKADSGYLRFYWNVFEDTGSSDTRDNTWRLITFVRNKTNSKFQAYFGKDQDIDNSYAGLDLSATSAPRFGMDSRSGSTAFRGQIDEPRVFNKALSVAEINDLNDYYPYVTTNYAGSALLKKYASTEPTFSLGAEDSYYPTTNPTINPSTSGTPYNVLFSFSQTLDSGSAGNIKYQISPNDGSTWYWWSGSSWSITESGYTESNTAAEINTNIATFTAGSAPKVFLWRAYLNSNGNELPKLTSVTLGYYYDTVAPDNPVLATKKSQNGGADIVSGVWYNYSSPYFTWTAPSDNAGEGEANSEIAGYYVYFGTSSTGDPHSTRGIATELNGTGIHYQTDTDFELGVDTAALTSGQTYYLRIETKDNAGNIKHITTENLSLFEYKYDGTSPTSPSYVSVSPSGYSRTNDFTFSWPTSGDNRAQDSDSGLRGYQYKINSGTWSNVIDVGSVNVSDVAVQGVNVFYLRAIDNTNLETPDNLAVVGNYDATPVSTNFYFNDAAPSAPTGTNDGRISVSPATSDENSFTFSWAAPAGEIAGYYYSINEPPSLSNITFTTATTVGPDAFATRQGENIFYLVAKDNAGNYDFSGCAPTSVNYNPSTDTCAAVAFSANTSAPGIPSITQQTGVIDGSNRDIQQYKVFLTWTAPTSLGAGFAGYEIYRSLDGIDFSSIGSTTGTTYADTGLESKLYYYLVKSKDNANQYSSASTIVSITPTGRYTVAPKIVGNEAITTHSYSADISWTTVDDAIAGQTADANHTAQGFVYYSTNKDLLGTSEGAILAEAGSSNNHEINIPDLLPETAYWYKLVWKDVDGQIGQTEAKQFTTGSRPTISEVTFNNIYLDRATVNWQSTYLSNAKIKYCIKDGTCAAEKSVNDSSLGQKVEHSIQLADLNHSTTYSVIITGYSEEGKPVKSDEYFFDTLTMPKIDGEVTYDQDIEAATTTYRLNWKTNVATSTIVYYQKNGGTKMSVSEPNFVKDHNLKIGGLADQSMYTFEVTGMDSNGIAIDNALIKNITTPNDTRAPKVSNMTIEIKSSGFGELQKAHVVVSWETDESATSQVEYEQGISGAEYKNRSKEDNAYSTSHVVILSELEPSKIYHLRAVSRDGAGNLGASDDTTVITGKTQKSVLDIIVNSLERSLGWMTNIFKFH